MNSPIPPVEDSFRLELVSRPLLRVVQYITGMESSFVTTIDWDAQTQDILYSLNTAEMQVPEGARTDWSDSMCRSLFLAGLTHSSDVGTQVPATAGAAALEMKSFFAVPILVGDHPIGTVCGASRSAIKLSDAQMDAMQGVAEALQQLLWASRDKAHAEMRAEVAELGAREAWSEAERHASDSLRMEQLAHTDMLTGLPNRRAFIARWEDELARSGRRRYPLGLLLIDADRFKDVNDSLGHHTGDAVLQAVGSTLMAVAHSGDVVARLGGDEFALITSHAHGDALLALAEDIRARFAVATSKLGVNTTLSIGIVSSDDCPRDRMMTDADIALYRSKGAGGDRAELYECPQEPTPT